MRGPKLVGVRADRRALVEGLVEDLLHAGRKPDEERAATYVVNRDGTGLQAADARTKRARSTCRRPDGSIARASGCSPPRTATSSSTTRRPARRRVLTRTAAAESDAALGAQRHGRHVHARRQPVSDVARRSGEPPPFAQLTDIVARRAADGGALRRRARRRGGGAGGGAAAAAARRPAAAAARHRRRDTEAQRCLREAGARADRVHPAAGGGPRRRGGGAADAAAVAAAPAATPAPIADRAASSSAPRQTLADVQLSADEQLRVGRRHRAAGGHRARSGRAELRHRVVLSGDDSRPHERRRRAGASAARDPRSARTNKAVWADALGVRRRRAQGQAGGSRTCRACSTGACPTCPTTARRRSSRCARRTTRIAGSCRVDPATGKATVLDTLHDDAWIREAAIGGGRGRRIRRRRRRRWLPDNKRVLFLSEKTGYMHALLARRDRRDAAGRRALTSGKWEVTSAQLSSDRKTMFLTTNEVHPGERHFYTMSVDGGARDAASRR